MPRTPCIRDRGLGVEPSIGKVADTPAAANSSRQQYTATAVSPAIEAERRLPPGLVEAFLDAGLFQIIFRDIHTAAHVMIGPLTYEAAGRVELSCEAEFPSF